MPAASSAVWSVAEGTFMTPVQGVVLGGLLGHLPVREPLQRRDIDGNHDRGASVASGLVLEKLGSGGTRGRAWSPHGSAQRRSHRRGTDRRRPPQWLATSTRRMDPPGEHPSRGSIYLRRFRTQPGEPSRRLRWRKPWISGATPLVIQGISLSSADPKVRQDLGHRVEGNALFLLLLLFHFRAFLLSRVTRGRLVVPTR